MAIRRASGGVFKEVVQPGQAAGYDMTVNIGTVTMMSEAARIIVGVAATPSSVIAEVTVKKSGTGDLVVSATAHNEGVRSAFSSDDSLRDAIDQMVDHIVTALHRLLFRDLKNDFNRFCSVAFETTAAGRLAGDRPEGCRKASIALETTAARCRPPQRVDVLGTHLAEINDRLANLRTCTSAAAGRELQTGRFRAPRGFKLNAANWIGVILNPGRAGRHHGIMLG